MNRLLLTVLLVLTFSSIVLSQTGNSSAITEQQSQVRIDSVPLSDNLSSDKPPTRKGKPVFDNHGWEDGDEKDESQSRFWGSAEYLLWKMKGSSLPPLITVGPESGQAILGEPGTVIVFGDERLERGKFPGGRFTIGVRLNQKGSLGLEMSYFFLKERTFRFEISSSGQPGSQVISRPYFDTALGREAVRLVAFPPFLTSGTSAALSPSKLYGAEANFLRQLKNVHNFRVKLLAGFRYLDLSEQLDVASISDNHLDPLNTVHFFNDDQFSTHNQFYGGQLGARSYFGKRRLSLELEGRVAIGNTRESVEINGATFTSNNFPHNRTGGLLALISNIGQYRRSKFTVAPEVRTSVAYNFTNYLQALVSYDFLYWNKVVRPGDQIDRVVNPQLVPLFGTPSLLARPLRPAFTFNDIAFWAQGLSLGIHTRF